MILKAVSAITRGMNQEPDIIRVPRGHMHMQIGGVNCGLHLALNAEAHILNNRVTRIENFDINNERDRVLKILSAYLPGNDGVPHYVAPNWCSSHLEEIHLVHDNILLHDNSFDDDMSFNIFRDSSENTDDESNESACSFPGKTNLRDFDFLDNMAYKRLITTNELLFMKSYCNMPKCDKRKRDNRTKYNRIQKRIWRKLHKSQASQTEAESNAHTKRERRSNQTPDEKSKSNREKMEHMRILRQEKKGKCVYYREAIDSVVCQRYSVGQFGEQFELEEKKGQLQYVKIAEFKCKYCHALHFEKELKGTKKIGIYDQCCNKGNVTKDDVKVDLDKPFPQQLKDLFLRQDSSFIGNIRRLNSDYALASMYAKTYEFDKQSKFNCYRIHGQVYRNMNVAAEANVGSQPKGGQIFFYDENEAVDIRNSRIKCPKETLATIETCLRDNNPSVNGYTYMKDVLINERQKAKDKGESEPDVNLLFGANLSTDASKHNIKRVNEVAAVFVSNAEGDIPEAEIVIHTKNKEFITIKQVVQILRNLILDKGLCNGTRLLILKILNHLLHCLIISGDKSGQRVLIPRITLTDDDHFDGRLHRKQFPVRLAFAMTINKSQGQTLDFVGLDLSRDVFSHGQLYVGVSRVRSWKNLKVMLPKRNVDGKVLNVVWKSVL